MKSVLRNSIIPSTFILAMIGFSICLMGCSPPTSAPAPQNAARTVAQGIIGGKVDSIDENLSLSILALVDKNSGDIVCTGTLLSSRVVLTAGHCVLDYTERADDLIATFGPSAWTQDNPQQIPSARIEIHPVYNNLAQLEKDDATSERCAKTGCSVKTLAQLNGADIALILLSESAPEESVPVHLNLDRDVLKKNPDAWAAGFGRHHNEDELDTGFLRFFKTKILQRIHGVDLKPFRKLAVPSTRDQGVCFGDSGGPSFIRKGTEIIQIGIAQGALHLDSPKKSKQVYACAFKAVGYTEVAAFAPWIEATRATLEKAGLSSH